MTALILRFWKWLTTRPAPASGRALAVPPASGEATARELAPRLKPAPELSPLWHLRSTILDRLDEYFVCIRRLQRHDPDSYKLFARVGFAVPADAYANPEAAETKLLVANAQVAFGGILCGGFANERGHDTCHPSFLYFTKVQRPSGVQRGGAGDVYRVSALYDDRDKSRHYRASLAALGTCHVRLDPDGTATLLKERVEVRARIVSRHRHGKGRREVFTLATRQWSYPGWITANETAMGRAWICDLFIMALVTYNMGVKRIVVRAKSGGCVAAFGIELPRAKYFFADRELAADGDKKRIFHAVTAHARRLARGGTTQVQHHYRGVRDFGWNGYQIHIVLPKHTRVLGFKAPSRYLEDVPKRERAKYYDGKETGRVIADVLSE